MPKPYPISQSLKDVLTQRIHTLYEHQLEHQPDEITYLAFGNTLVILMERTLTKPEQVLKERDHQELARKVRRILDEHVQPQLKALIEDVTESTVVDFLYDSTIDTERTGAIAMFELTPKLSVQRRSP